LRDLLTRKQELMRRLAAARSFGQASG